MTAVSNLGLGMRSVWLPALFHWLNYIAVPAALVLLIIFLVKNVSLKKQIHSDTAAPSHSQ